MPPGRRLGGVNPTMNNLMSRFALCLAATILLASFGAQAQQPSVLANVPGIQPYHPWNASPAMARAHQACGWAKTAKARMDGCTRLIQHEPDLQVRASALDNRGNEKAAVGDFDGALADFNAANRLWPEFEGPYIDRAMVHIERGDAAGAIAEYDGLIKLDPDSSAFDGRCWARALAGVALDAALSDCNQAIKLSAYDAVSYEDRAIIWFRRGDMDRVITDTDFALGLSSESARALYLRGLAKLALGRTDEGRADIASAQASDAAAVKFLARWGLKP